MTEFTPVQVTLACAAQGLPSFPVFASLASSHALLYITDGGVYKSVVPLKFLILLILKDTT